MQPYYWSPFKGPSRVKIKKKEESGNNIWTLLSTFPLFGKMGMFSINMNNYVWKCRQKIVTSQSLCRVNGGPSSKLKSAVKHKETYVNSCKTNEKKKKNHRTH